MKVFPLFRTLVLAGGSLLLAAGCNVSDKPNYMIYPQINHMAFSKAQESQGVMYTPRYNPTIVDRDEAPDGVIKIAHGDGRTLLLPPEGTIRRRGNPMLAQTEAVTAEMLPLHYPVDEAGAKAAGFVDDKGNAKLADFATAQAKKAGEELKNPFAGEPSKETLARAEEVYVTFCSPCHGTTGMGDGPVSKRGVPGFPLAPKDAPPVGYKDGHIFHIVSYGRGMMGSYASQIAPEDRWKAVLWVRELQKKAAAGGQGG